MDAHTIIENWYLVDFTHEGRSMDKRVLWGIVVEDRKGRWIPGDWCCTSLVVKEHDDQLFETANSFYKAEGAGTRIEAPAAAIQLLRSGFSPDQWPALASLGDKLSGV